MQKIKKNNMQAALKKQRITKPKFIEIPTHVLIYQIIAYLTIDGKSMYNLSLVNRYFNTLINSIPKLLPIKPALLNNFIFYQLFKDKEPNLQADDFSTLLHDKLELSTLSRAFIKTIHVINYPHLRNRCECTIIRENSKRERESRIQTWIQSAKLGDISFILFEEGWTARLFLDKNKQCEQTIENNSDFFRILSSDKKKKEKITDVMQLLPQHSLFKNNSILRNKNILELSQLLYTLSITNPAKAILLLRMVSNKKKSKTVSDLCFNSITAIYKIHEDPNYLSSTCEVGLLIHAFGKSKFPKLSSIVYYDNNNRNMQVRLSTLKLLPPPQPDNLYYYPEIASSKNHYNLFLDKLQDVVAGSDFNAANCIYEISINFTAEEAKELSNKVTKVINNSHCLHIKNNTKKKLHDTRNVLIVMATIKEKTKQSDIIEQLLKKLKNNNLRIGAIHAIYLIISLGHLTKYKQDDIVQYLIPYLEDKDDIIKCIIAITISYLRCKMPPGINKKMIDWLKNNNSHKLKHGALHFIMPATL